MRTALPGEVPSGVAITHEPERRISPRASNGFLALPKACQAYIRLSRNLRRDETSQLVVETWRLRFTFNYIRERSNSEVAVTVAKASRN